MYTYMTHEHTGRGDTKHVANILCAMLGAPDRMLLADPYSASTTIPAMVVCQ